MRTYRLVHPGREPTTAMELTRQEFLTRFPRPPILIENDGVTETITIPPDRVLCDLCNADPGDAIMVLGNAVYCTACRARHLAPFLT